MQVFVGTQNASFGGSMPMPPNPLQATTNQVQKGRLPKGGGLLALRRIHHA